MLVFEELVYLLSYDNIVVSREVAAHTVKLLLSHLYERNIRRPRNQLLHRFQMLLSDVVYFLRLDHHLTLVLEGHQHEIKQCLHGLRF